MKELNKHNIYVVENGSKHFLYAPLCGIIAESSHKEIENFRCRLADGEVVPELKAMMHGRLPLVLNNPNLTNELTILINQRCNFACKYCYSANGRNNEELPEYLYDPLVKWFINPSKRGRKLTVTFSGGGDPSLSMDKVIKIVGMMRAHAISMGIEIDFGIVCNGSHIHPDDVEFIRNNVSNFVISFDVIPQVHEAQRSHYGVVAETIRTLLTANVKVGLRSTITELNVDRMEEMIEVLHHDFFGCKAIAAEAVLSPRMWIDNLALASFYSRFATNYFRAQTLADNYGISLGNTIDISSEGLKSRACEGKVVVTPEGRLTACSRVATSGDNFFHEFVFGQVTESGVIYDADKYERIMQVRSEKYAECHSCFARYHCGGGCMMARLVYTPEQMRLHCYFTRQILKHKIFNELD